MSKYVIGFFILTLSLLNGCRTGGVFLRETPLNVSETRRIIVSVIGEPMSISQNGRELMSHYYDKKNIRIEKMATVKERFHSRVTILGDRRPYDIQVEVVVERRNPDGNFDLLGQDDGRANGIAEKIRKALNQSRDSRNVIDDFRSF